MHCTNDRPPTRLQDYGDDGSQKCSGANCVYDILMANFQVG